MLSRVQLFRDPTDQHIATSDSDSQSYPTLSDPKDCIPAGSSVHGISQARILEQVAIFYSRGSS